MIIHHVRVMTKPGLQAGAHHPPTSSFVLVLRPIPFRVVRRLATCLALLTAVSVAALHAQSAPDARYRVTSTAVISLDRAPQPALVDTIVTTSILSIAISAGADTIATLSLDSLQLVSTGMVRRAADAFSHGISLSAPLSSGRPRVVGDSATACSSERPLAGLLPELLPLLPVQLIVDQQWSDTLTVTTCRAGLPVTTVTIATYHILSGMDSATVLLERRAVIRASGSATLRAQTVSLTGSGTSQSLAVVTVSGRRIQSWRGSQSLEIVLTNGQQTRHVVQELTDSASAIP